LILVVGLNEKVPHEILDQEGVSVSYRKSFSLLHPLATYAMPPTGSAFRI